MRQYSNKRPYWHNWSDKCMSLWSSYFFLPRSRDGNRELGETKTLSRSEQHPEPNICFSCVPSRRVSLYFSFPTVTQALVCILNLIEQRKTRPPSFLHLCGMEVVFGETVGNVWCPESKGREKNIILSHTVEFYGRLLCWYARKPKFILNLLCEHVLLKEIRAGKVQRSRFRLLREE